MNFNELAEYRDDDGYIDIYNLFEKNPYLKQKLMIEARGNKANEKYWLQLDDCSVLIKFVNCKYEDNNILLYNELLVEQIAGQVGLGCAYSDLVKYNEKLGILSKNVLESGFDVLILQKTLLDILFKCNLSEMNREYDCVGNILDSFKYCKDYDGVSTFNIEKLQMEFCKMLVFDIIIMNSNRDSTNFAIIYNKKENSMRLSPLYANGNAFGSTILKECTDMRKAKNNIEKYSDSILSKIELSTKDMKNLEQKIEECKINTETTNWGVILIYLLSLQNCSEIKDFLGKCIQKIDIKEALKNVEKRIKNKLPINYKKGVQNLYNARINSIKAILKEDIQ